MIPPEIVPTTIESIVGKSRMPDSTAETPFMDWNQTGRKYTVPKVSQKVMMLDHAVFLLNMYDEEPMQRVAQKPPAMLRCLKMWGGIVAVFGSNIWMATKATSNTAIRVNNAMIRPLLH